jgi:hypothetical protein
MLNPVHFGGLDSGGNVTWPTQASPYGSEHATVPSSKEGAHHICARIGKTANTACNTSRTDIDFIMYGSSPRRSAEI